MVYNPEELKQIGFDSKIIVQASFLIRKML